MKNSKWGKYNLTTITPVFIGSDKGSDLSKTTDFIVDGNKISIIDQRKFEALLSNNIKLIDEFVSEIKSNPRSFDLQNFIENKLNASVSELTKTTIDVDGYLSSNSVNTFITSNGSILSLAQQSKVELEQPFYITISIIFKKVNRLLIIY